MKKLALMLTLVLVFTVSCVFAAPAPEVSGEVNNTVISGEVTSGETDITTVVDSGDEEDLATSGDVNIDTDHDHDHDHEQDIATDTSETTDTDKSATVGAIIAIVIVVIVVAIAAILKKD